MLRANLYKKFSKSNLPKAVDGVKTSNTEESVSSRNPVQPIAPLKVEERNNIILNPPYFKSTNSGFKFPTGPFTKPAPPTNSYTTEAQPDGTITEGNSSYAPGTFNTNKASNTFTADAAPFISNINSGNIYDVDQNTAATEQGPLTQSETVKRGVMTPDKTIQNLANPAKKKSNLDYNSMFTLGLGAIDMGLGYNEDLKNQRILNESIQNRQSKPLYDYNYMYGRTTSGGTEYQPTIKAEMGAQITKRFNTPYGANNVEIEGGEFIQLPDFNTEHAEGPSHDNGGIKTNLPEGTRVYSDHLKPEGSKKTFAQLAKKHDISSFQKTLDDPFKKQVDKDTATIMLRRNQQKLDELFNQQQSMNGNSNGEMRDGGINNPGFRALPKAVQDQIIANMEYGGYQLPEYGIGGRGFKNIDTTPVASVKPNLKSAPKNVQALVNNPAGVTKEGIPTYTEDQIKEIQKWDPNFNPTKAGVPSLQKTQGNIYGTQSNQDLFNKNYKWYIDKIKAEGKIFDPSRKGDVEAAQKAYHSEMTKRFIDAGYTPEEASAAITKYGFTDKAGVPNAIDDKLGLYTASRELFNVAKKTPETPVVEKTEETPIIEPEFPKGNTYGMQGTTPKGTYVKDPFNMGSLIPNAYGLSQAQTTYSYGIPEIDSPYLRPQTLNVQSQLQDIDNMGTAAVRGGADPLATYIAGMDAKQKTFQTKQNFDAEGRGKADMFNAQAKTQADMFNAEAFDKNYNERNALAKAYQSQEKSKQLANAVDKYSNWDKTEGSKKFLYDNFVTSFDLDRAQNDAMTVAGEAQPFYVGNPLQNIVDNAMGTSTEKKTTTKTSNTKKLPK
jgi:hypothetical protein